ncbi:MAG: S26 family signal peptidase [Sumerlaeia bacterium]
MMNQKTTSERILERKQKREGKAQAKEKAPEEQLSFPRKMRGWSDALFFAFTLAMFIRVFLFELFMIPTGSMTPTLIGDDAQMISEFDYNQDGNLDTMVVNGRGGNYAQIYLKNNDGNFDRLVVVNNLPSELLMTFAQPPKQQNFFAGLMNSLGFGLKKDDPTRSKGRRDMIMVNKFAFWFSEPERGDITIFKVPDRPERNNPFDILKPVYIKRVAAGPTEELIIQNVKTPIVPRFIGDEGRITPEPLNILANDSRNQLVEIEVESNPLLVNGEPLNDPLYNSLLHFPHQGLQQGFPNGNVNEEIFPISQDDPGYVLLGDNQLSSSDSRVWGRVPRENIRGKAIIRYWPAREFTFLHHGD